MACRGKQQLHIGIAGPFDLVEGSQFLEPPLPTGRGYATRVTVALAGALLERGHRLTIFTTSTDPADVGTYRGQGIEVVVVPMRPRRRWPDFFRAERRELCSVMEKAGCDVLHAHWTYEFAIAAMRSRSAPVLVTIRDWAPEVLRRQRHPYRVVRLLMQAYVFARAPHLTANSPYIAEKVKRWYRRSVPVVPNGIELPLELPDRRQRTGLVIGSVNNGFGERKNVHCLVDSLPLIRKAHPEASLRLVGADFEPGGPAESYARSRGLTDGIEFLGPVPSGEIGPLMRSLDVLVHPSLEESFGMTLVEALVEGTPVVAGESSGAVPWVLGNGRAGTLVDVRDPQAIAAAILSIPVDEEHALRRRREAFEHVRENFALRAVVDRFEQIYRELASEVE
ncbi:MAG: glycosyltransferase family 4 protein [bacterium]|nr:glycosyltransferase family 4 protein [bacterium]